VIFDDLRQFLVGKNVFARPVWGGDRPHAPHGSATAMTQTAREAECQTTALPKEKAVQTSKDTEMQPVDMEMAMEQEDKFISTTFLFAISKLVKHANESLVDDIEYKMLKDRYDETILMMKNRGYPIAPNLAEAAKIRLAKRQPFTKK
jgi:hypothetical protein